MKKSFLNFSSLLFICWLTVLPFSTAFAQAPAPISILEAVQQKLVSIEAQGKGGYNGKCLNIEVKSLSPKPLQIKVLAGTIFDNTEEWQQDLMIVEEQMMVLNVKKTNFISLQTVCVQPSNGSPAKGVRFLLSKLAEGYLLKLAQFISEKKYFTSTAQSAVWAVINNNGMGEIYGEDSLMVKGLCAIVSEATGQLCNSSNYKPRPHSITSIRTSLDALIPDYTKKASLTLYKRNGEVFRNHAGELALSPGFYRFKMGVNHTLSDTSTFILRLEENGKVISEKIVKPNDSVPDLQKMKEATLTYSIDNEINARIGVYDEADNLYILLADQKPLKKGFHKSEFLEAKRELPLGKNYYFKVKDNGKTIAQQKILLDRSEARKYAPLTKRGSFICKLDQDLSKAKLAVYDANDTIVWVIFSESKLGRGQKNIPFVFQHQYGAEAIFTLKLTDSEGNIIATQEVKAK